MIKVTFTPDKYDLTIEGHAGCGEKGQDIVCSAASMLFYTLIYSYNESRKMLEWRTYMDKDGNGHCACIPKKGYEDDIARTYWTIMQGFKLLAGNYPDNVKIFLK